jgi:HlyD family secretion protein
VTRAGRAAVWALGFCLGGCSVSASQPTPRIAEVRRQDLVVGVEVTGALKALDSDSISPPPIPYFWEFKIARMAPEGAQVKAGDPVMAFDPSELQKRLRDFENEAATISEELGKARAEATMARLNDRLEGEQKAAEARKAELRADKPRDLTAEVQLRAAEMDRDLGRREVELQEVKATNNRRSERADLQSLQNRLQRAQAHLQQTEESVAKMSVKALRPGTVVYKQNWRGEKRKVGDQLYPGDSAIEVALLDRMGADGQVDEVDASKVRKGQRVGLRLEANPDVEHVGVVTRIAALVGTESPESRIKVAHLEIQMEKTDPTMRPGMRVRGLIQVDRIPSVLQVPLQAVRTGREGPEVLRVAGAGSETVKVRLGRRSREAVEVLGGLREGDQVALRGGPAGPSSTGGAVPLAGGSR